MPNAPMHDRMANAIRFLSADAVEKANSGHPGLPMGAADVATVLFSKALKFDPTDPHWPDRDRFILSAGHGSMLLYSALHLTGYKKMTIGEIERFRQLGSLTPGHPEVHHTPGVETTTGPLGQGIATAVGFALAERMLAAEFGEIVDHRTYVLASDGDLMEGVSHEAAAIAGHMKLAKLIVFHDDNGISIDGPLTMADGVDQVARFKACGWNASHVDGHDAAAILRAIKKAWKSDKPSFISCKTTIGFGAPKRAGTSKAHGEALGAEELAGARKALGWDYPPFVVPEDVAAAWRKPGRKGKRDHKAWKAKLAALPADKRAEFERRVAGKLPAALDGAIDAHKRKMSAEAPSMATRKSGEAALKAIAPAMPELITGSADLTPSNNTKVEATPDMQPPTYAGRYVHWGIREHGMAAACNGMALHGGFAPSGASFMCFTDYARPSLRLAALMGVRVVHAFTHDSIGLGEDGPTHQPVEHLAALRAMPNLYLFRPCDAVETAECWQKALELPRSPSILALTRQNLPTLRKTHVEENLSAKGAYEIAPADGEAKVSIFATGSEVAIAVAAQALLKERGVAARVVSVPCMDLFHERPEAERRATIGKAKVKVAVEAAVRQGWDWIIGDGPFVGMAGFGASAPIKDLYAHFGITAEAVAEAALKRL
ncbi:MAG: transketolase [Hyphomicrobiales bacterium]|nr:transketolase [Hyphomicrobiales bacterium]MDE2016739.1 transketolase [Hyphomicrobiales bacterium]